MATPAPISEAGPQDAEERSSHGVLATALLIVFLVVLMLVFWRSCAPVQDDPGTASGGTIQTLDDLEVAPGGVAVWLKPDASLTEVLGRNGLSDATTADMGEGTFVIGIGDADASEIVERLTGDPGLYDAGFLYVEE